MNDNEPIAKLFDTTWPAVAELIQRGRARGFMTYDELNAVLPKRTRSAHEIYELMTQLSDIGIEVLETTPE